MAESPRSEGSELRRLDEAGALWFGMTLIAGAVGLAGLVAAGWRPGDLAAPFAVVWWAGAVLAFGGVACLGWAGCPVLGATLRGTLRGKSVTVRVGLVVYLVGTAAAAVAVLVG